MGDGDGGVLLGIAALDVGGAFLLLLGGVGATRRRTREYAPLCRAWEALCLALAALLLGLFLVAGALASPPGH